MQKVIRTRNQASPDNIAQTLEMANGKSASLSTLKDRLKVNDHFII